jgi:hypothetical protein
MKHVEGVKPTLSFNMETVRAGIAAQYGKSKVQIANLCGLGALTSAPTASGRSPATGARGERPT